MVASYWQGLAGVQRTRRAVLRGGAGLAGAAALLAACGSGKSGDSATSSGVKVVTDTKEEGPVKTGGTFKRFLPADLASLDPYKQTSAVPCEEIGTYALNRLVNFKSGPGIDPNAFEVAPDLATSYEISNDGLTYTFKLRPNVKFHNIAPVSGRVFDADDVLASYQRYKATGQYGNSFQGLVADVTAPDKQTVVFNLVKPNAAFLNILATFLFFWIFPKEAGVSYDPLKTVIGTGPFFVSNYLPSERIEYKRHPDYYEPGIPYMDGAVSYILPEPAQELAQFAAGSVFHYIPSQFSDFQSLVQSIPGLRIIASGLLASTQGVAFGRTDASSPFLKDERVRRAVSLTLDRQTLMETFNDIDKYKSIGLSRDYAFANFVPPNLADWWVDPRGKEMGDAAQWFQFDAGKAKQLLSAAGYDSGFETNLHFSQNQGGDQYENLQPLLADWFAAGGIRAKLVGEDYVSVLAAHSWRGETDGLVNWFWQTFGDPGLQLDYLFGPNSTRNQMAVNDPTFNSMFEQQQRELDASRRKAELIQLYQYLGNQMRHVPFGFGSINTFLLYQPQVRNLNAYQTADSVTTPVGTNTLHWWLAS